MALKEKYQDVVSFAEQLGLKDGGWKEDGGKLHGSGTVAYSYDKNRIWDKIKTHAGWKPRWEPTSRSPTPTSTVSTP